MKKAITCRLTAVLLAAVMCAGLCAESIVHAQEVSGQSATVHSLKNPDGDIDLSAEGGYRTTWDCIWFGSYPQAEVVESAELYGEVDEYAMKDGDIIEDPQLYQELSSKNEEDWDENRDIVLSDGNKYHKMSMYDTAYGAPGMEGKYKWAAADRDHYFKYEPIKWRVLKVDGEQALLLSDQALDTVRYNEQSDKNVTWETSTVRSWLNNEFLNKAFSQEEQSSIADTNLVNNVDGTGGGRDTTDKIFLLSYEDAYDSSAGFMPRRWDRSETRWSWSSTYAKAVGAYFYTEGVNKGGGGWWLRTPAGSSVSTGIVADGNTEQVCNWGTGIRASLNIKLSSNHYTYAGKVCSDGTKGAGGSEDDGNSGISLNNPRMVKDSGMQSGQKVTWDCVWFGSYPQAEVVPSADNYTALDQKLLNSGDLIEDRSLYDRLKSAPESEWNQINDITIDGEKYRRLEKRDVHVSGRSGSGYYKWSDSEPYHYFKYEPVKWRVLRVDGGQRALLLADKGLDAQMYNFQCDSVTWETSMIRSWLNGYGKTANQEAMDYLGTSVVSRNFLSSAFSKKEKAVIEDTYVVNADNIKNKTEGGNDTTDKIFLLSESETFGNGAVPYGFTASGDTKDEGRTCKTSTYAKAMSAYANSTNKGDGFWWLRSPGDSPDRAVFVYFDGRVVSNKKGDDPVFSGGSANTISYSVRPALNLKLASDCYTSAGTISSEEKVYVTGGNRPPVKRPVKVSRITLSGISKQIAAGKNIKLTASVMPSNASNKAVTWKSSNKKVATVTKDGVVKIKKKTGGRSVTITATAMDGSNVKGTYKIKSMKGVVKKIAISGKKTVKAGKTLKLKAKVTATKKANKKIKWSSSNKKYASVSSSGKVKALKAGKKKKVKITAMATDGSGKKKTVTIRIK